MRLYLTGLGIGVIVMYIFIWKDKDIYKTPEEEILARMEYYTLSESVKTACKLKCIGFPVERMKTLLKEAEITNLGSDEVRQNPPLYRIATNAKSSPIDTIYAAMKDSSFILQDVILSESSDPCACK